MALSPVSFASSNENNKSPERSRPPLWQPLRPRERHQRKASSVQRVLSPGLGVASRTPLYDMSAESVPVAAASSRVPSSLNLGQPNDDEDFFPDLQDGLMEKPGYEHFEPPPVYFSLLKKWRNAKPKRNTPIPLSSIPSLKTATFNPTQKIKALDPKKNNTHFVPGVGSYTLARFPEVRPPSRFRSCTPRTISRPVSPERDCHSVCSSSRPTTPGPGQYDTISIRSSVIVGTPKFRPPQNASAATNHRDVWMHGDILLDNFAARPPSTDVGPGWYHKDLYELSADNWQTKSFNVRLSPTSNSSPKRQFSSQRKRRLR